MTCKCYPEEINGELKCVLCELRRRVNKGAIPPQRAIDDIQSLIDGKTFQSTFVDTDADPMQYDEKFIPVFHKKMGLLKWDPAKAFLYLSQNQQGSLHISGHSLRMELENMPALNANVLDYLLERQRLIPGEWYTGTIFFWGTIYGGSDGHLYVRSLSLIGDSFIGNSISLDCQFYNRTPAAIYR